MDLAGVFVLGRIDLALVTEQAGRRQKQPRAPLVLIHCVEADGFVVRRRNPQARLHLGHDGGVILGEIPDKGESGVFVIHQNTFRERVGRLPRNVEKKPSPDLQPGIGDSSGHFDGTTTSFFDRRQETERNMDDAGSHQQVAWESSGADESRMAPRLSA
jgi:hypothetical protein